MSYKTANVDCFYVTYAFFPEKRNEPVNKMILAINNQRTKIGLSLIDDDLKKKIFSLDHKEYIFPEVIIEGMNFETKSDSESFKNLMFKIK